MVPELADESFGVILIVADRPVFAERALYSNAGGVLLGRRQCGDGDRHPVAGASSRRHPSRDGGAP